jgi:hypothetical protein
MWRTILLLAGAVFAGFIGGLAHSQNPEPSPISVIRTSRLDLVDGKGVIVGQWDSAAGGSRIRFLSRRGSVIMEIGADADGRPDIQMLGEDGKRRVTISLNARDKPLFAMSDERWQGRVVLGFLDQDFPDPGVDKWGLLFRAFGSEHAVASIGSSKLADGASEGYVTVSGKSVK